MDSESRSVGLSGRLLRDRDQWTLIVLLTCLLSMISIMHVARGGQESWLPPEHPFAWRYEPRIDLNRAGWAELCLLPGVGESRARDIVLHRERQGSFLRIEDLGQVPGIGPKTIQAVRHLIWVDQGSSDLSPRDITRLPTLN
jgi:competence protein ComEA